MVQFICMLRRSRQPRPGLHAVGEVRWHRRQVLVGRLSTGPVKATFRTNRIFVLLDSAQTIGRISGNTGPSAVLWHEPLDARVCSVDKRRISISCLGLWLAGFSAYLKRACFLRRLLLRGLQALACLKRLELSFQLANLCCSL